MLLAIENAPPGKRAWYGMFPQLGAPVGFFFSGGVFLLLSRLLTDEQFFAFGWRIPFLASAVLVLVGLYVRLTITETPVFRDARASRSERVKVPMLVVFRDTRRRWSSASLVVARDLRAVLPDDRVRAVVGHDGARLHARDSSCSFSCSASSVFARDDSDLRASLAERGRRRMLIAVTIAHRRLRPRAWRRCFDGGHGRRGGDDGRRAVARWA